MFLWTRAGVCKTLDEDGAKVQILLPGRTTPRWISRTLLVRRPSAFLLVKKANFDQKCGCTSVIEVHHDQVEFYNLYGDLRKYLCSDCTSPVEGSAYSRHKFLATNGFIRAKGVSKTIEQIDSLVFNYQSGGYEIVMRQQMPQKQLQPTS
jgi:hypothetical protein